MFCAEKVKNDCVAWIRDFFEKNGPGCNAVLGVSGGKIHTVEEFAYLDSLRESAKRVAAVIYCI